MNLAKWQKKIFILCWLAYAGGYLCRTNLSIVLPQMIDAFEWNKTTVGLIGSAFFWSYAVGQLINGHIGDRVDCRLFIFAGLTGAALMNVFAGCSNNLVLIIILWTVNGFCLSMLWGPMVKTFSLWFPSEKYSAVAVGISTSMIAGYFMAWGFVGSIISYTSWRYAFRVPALIVAAYAFYWLLQMKNRPEEVGLALSSGTPVREEAVEAEHTMGPGRVDSPSLLEVIRSSRLWILAVACIAQGIVKDSITLWGPTFIVDTQGLSQRVMSVVSLAIPLFSLAGILLAGRLNSLFGFRAKRTITVLITAAAVTCVLTYISIPVNGYLSILFLSFSAGLMYGANSLLLTVIPLSFSGCNKVSAVAGFLDFASYMGAAAAGVLTGFIADHMNWSTVVLLWLLLSLLGGGSVWLSAKCDEKGTPPILKSEVERG